MPNLIPSIDTSDIYNEDIDYHYNFVDCGIDSIEYRLKYAIGIYNGDNCHIYLLTDISNRHLAVVRLVETNVFGVMYHQISKSYAIVQQRGYGEILYENVLRLHTTSVISDHLNTLPGSFNLWKKLINKNSISIYRFDTIRNRRYRLQLPLDEFLVWGVDETFLEVIKKTPWSAVNLEDDSNAIQDDSEDAAFVDYLTENDVIQRTILSDFIVKALQNRKRVKNRRSVLLLVKNSS